MNKVKVLDGSNYNAFQRLLYEHPLTQLTDHIKIFNREFENVLFMGHGLDYFIQNLPESIHSQYQY